MVRFAVISAFLFVCVMAVSLTAKAAHKDNGVSKLEVLATFDFRPGNPALAPDGSIYISMHPFDGPDFKIMKLDGEGDATPYPNEAVSKSFAAVIGVFVTRDGVLWILDMGNAEKSPSLTAWNTKNNRLQAVYHLPKEISVANSFHQDLAVDITRGFAFIADMSRGDLLGESKPAIVVVDLTTGKMRRVLEGEPALQPKSARPQAAEGKPMMLTKPDGSKHPIRLGLNPIGIDQNDEWVYFSTITPGPIYRVKASLLGDFSASQSDILAGIETIGEKPTSDGIAVWNETVFITNVEESRMTALKKGQLKTVSDDPRLVWPDGVAVDPKGALIVTVNQLNRAAPFNDGVEGAEGDYLVVRIPWVLD